MSMRELARFRTHTAHLKRGPTPVENVLCQVAPNTWRIYYGVCGTSVDGSKDYGNIDAAREAFKRINGQNK